MATTYNNLYLDIRQQLRRAGIEEATLEARELVCFGTNKSREELARDGGLYASPELEHRVRDLVRRHLEGEPVAYLIGEWEFYGLPLDISRDVLIPRPDTELLCEAAAARLPLVPGGGIYYAMGYCLEGDTEQFLSALLGTLSMAAALAVGVILASSLFRAVFPRLARVPKRMPSGRQNP